MKTLKRLMAFTLAAMMCMGLLSVGVSAEEKKTFTVVSLGDSTTNGYFLDDFGEYSEYAKENPKGYPIKLGMLGYASKYSFPYLFGEYLQKKMPDTEVIVRNLGLTSMRSDDLRKLLDPSFDNDQTSQGDVKRFKRQMKNYLGIEDAEEFYRDEIEKADVITLDCCMNNFNYYLIDRVTKFMDGSAGYERYAADTAERVYGTIPDSAKKLMEAKVALLVSKLSGLLPDGMVKGIADAIGYCYCDFCANFAAIIRIIKEINPKAEIIVCGAFNPVRDMTATISGITLSADAIFDILIEMVNTYITTLDANCTYYHYADISYHLDNACDMFARTETPADLSEPTMERAIYSIYSPSGSMDVSGIMSEKIRSAAQDAGVAAGSGDFTYDRVMAAYADVKNNGDSADALNKIICEVTDNFIDLILKSAAVNALDAGGLLDMLGGDIPAMAAELAGKEFDELTVAEKSLLRITALALFCDGFGAHLSYEGNRQKCKEVIKAYNTCLPALGAAGSSIAGIGNAVIKELKTIITAPLANMAEKLRELRHDIFARMFSAISSNLERFFALFEKSGGIAVH